jgi:hypothetical protein
MSSIRLGASEFNFVTGGDRARGARRGRGRARHPLVRAEHALVSGYRALLIVVAALYALAFVTGRSHLARPAGVIAEGGGT